MSFPKYPTYKDSGVEWLGEVPEHWVVAPLKRGFSVTLGKMLQPDANGPDDELLPYLRAANIQWTGVDVSDIKQMWLSPRDRGQLTLQLGDLLVSEGGDVGRSCIWQNEISNCAFQNSVNRVRATHGGSTRYLYYWMSTIKDKGYVDVLCNKSTIAHFTAEKVAAVPVPFPLLPEQTAIATFLDHETAKIDALIAEQEKLLKLLKDRLSSAVFQSTEACDLNTHRIEHVVDVIARPVQLSSANWYEPLGLFNRGRGLFHKELRPHDEMGDSDFFWVADGDLIISGQFAWEGAVALAGPEEEGCVVSHRYPILRGRDGVCITEYLYAFLCSEHGNFLLSENSRGAAGRNRPLNINSLLREVIQLPPISLQEKVKLAVHDLRQAESVISAQRLLLEERRTALINAAVTGQIDVRSWTPQVAA